MPGHHIAPADAAARNASDLGSVPVQRVANVDDLPLLPETIAWAQPVHDWAELERLCASLREETEQLTAASAELARGADSIGAEAGDELQRRISEFAELTAQITTRAGALLEQSTRLLDHYERVFMTRERALTRRDRAADRRDRAADERELIANEREQLADDRERVADQREGTAEERERERLGRAHDREERTRASSSREEAAIRREIAASERAGSDPDDQ